MPRKSRNDLIRAAVGYYLKNKNYVGERFRKSDFKLSQNRQEFMFLTMQACDLQRSNNFTYSNHTIANSQQILEQFGRFTQFVESQADYVRQELQRFYAPMLCHLYLELLKAREPEAAIEFLKKYAHLVAPVETYDVSSKINGCTTPNDVLTDQPTSTHIRFTQNMGDSADLDPELEYFVNLLQTLSTCTQLDVAESDADVALFRASKYEIHTTSTAVEALTKFLEKSGHVLILNLLNSWIQVHAIDNEQFTDEIVYFGSTLDEDMEEDNNCISLPKPSTKIKLETSTKHSIKCATNSNVQPPIEIKTEAKHSDDIDDAKKWSGNSISTHLDTIRMCREELVKSPVNFPRCIKIAERDRGLTSAHLDVEECHMVAGFNSSVIQLWQLNQRICSGKSLFRQKISNTCCWEINNCSKEEEDLIEKDIETHASSADSREKRKFFEGKYEDNSYNEYGGVKLLGHGLGITDVRFSKFHPLIYSVSKDTTMRSWHAESFNCASIYRGHQYPIWCFDESPLGTYMVTGSRDLTARLWSTEYDFPLITFTGHSQDVECTAFHPNGNYIATGSTDLSVRLWCTTSGKLMRVFSECKHAVTNVAFSPDGKLLAAAGEESKVRIFDLAAGAQLSELKDHTASVTSMAWSANGRQLVTVCRDGTLRVWDTKRLTTHDSNSSHNSSSYSSTFSSSSSSPNRLLAINSNCQRLVKAYFGRNDTICIGC